MNTTATVVAAVATAALTPVVLHRLTRATLREPFLAVLASEGPDAARRLLDARLPPTDRVALVGVRGVQAQRQRMAALGLLRDVTALRAESARHSGLFTAVIQVRGMALLGVALASDDPQPAAQGLSTLATRGRREGKLARLFAAGLVEAFADLARALGGAALSPSARGRLEQILSERGTQEVLLLHALERAYRASGEPVEAAAVAQRLQRITPHFGPSMDA